jgi:hypothetical protein
MESKIDLDKVFNSNGMSGWVDSANQTYRVYAKTIWWASLEQNEKLENELKKVYERYLKEVAEENNGLY